MSLTECPNGHLYNLDQYSSCPYCNSNIKLVVFSAPPGLDNGRNVSVSTAAQTPSVEMGAATASADCQDRQTKEHESGKTVAVFQKNLKRDPVAGWLVCIEGPEKGMDYRIAAKNNSIGRSESMDICIKGDQAISRTDHARLSYDGKHDKFYLIPSASVNNVYLNDEPVYVPSLLNPWDVIELGESKFIFIPLCCEKFNWQDGLKQDE